MVLCPNCGEENPEKFRLCGFCGTALAPALPPQETAGHCTAGNENYVSGQNIGQPKSYSSTVPKSSPPAGVLSLDKKAGLLGTYK